MRKSISTTLLQLQSAIESSLGFSFNRSLKKSSRSTALPTESWVSVRFNRFSYFRESSQKPSIFSFLPGWVQELRVLPYPGLEGLPPFKSAQKDQHHPKRHKPSQNWALCTKMRCICDISNLQVHINKQKDSFSTASLPALANVHLRFQLRSLLHNRRSKRLRTVLSQFVKDLSHSVPFFGWTLLVIDFVSTSQVLPFICWIMLDIAFVSDQENTLLGNVFLLGFAEIVIATLNSGFVREVEDTDTALRAFVVCTGEGPELLLPCSIPDLKIVRFFVNSRRVGLEVDTHCGKIDCIELGLA